MNQVPAHFSARRAPAIDVCVVGELNLDLILYGLPRELESDREVLAKDMKLTLGSSSAIFAHNLSALGTSVGFIARIGDDSLGESAVGRLGEAGVDVRRMVRGAGGTPTGLTIVVPHGSGRYILTYPGAMFELSYGDLDLEYVLNARHLHLSSYFLHRALRPRILDLFREAKRSGLTTSLDTNDDPEGRWGPDLGEVLKYVDVFLPNESEARKAAGTEDLERAIEHLADLSSIVVVKRGRKPAVCRRGGERWEEAPPQVAAVDDIGAGDTFDAGFIHLWLRGASLEESVRFAGIAAAYSVTREGGTEAFRDREGLGNFVREHWRGSRDVLSLKGVRVVTAGDTFGEGGKGSRG